MAIWASPLAETTTWERAGKGAELVAPELHSSQMAAIGDSETLSSFVQSKSGLKHSRDNSVYAPTLQPVLTFSSSTCVRASLLELLSVFISHIPQ